MRYIYTLLTFKRWRINIHFTLSITMIRHDTGLILVHGRICLMAECIYFRYEDTTPWQGDVFDHPDYEYYCVRNTKKKKIFS